MRIENKEGGNSMSNKSRHRRLLFMMGLVLFSLLGSIWISSNSGMTVYADSKTNITQNGTGSGTVINQQEESQISTVNSNTTDNTSSSDDPIRRLRSKLPIQKHNQEHQLTIISQFRRTVII